MRHREADLLVLRKARIRGNGFDERDADREREPHSRPHEHHHDPDLRQDYDGETEYRPDSPWQFLHIVARKIARNFHSFTSDHTDLLPAVSLTILPSSRILRKMLSILFIFCLSSNWSDKTSQRRFTISCFVRLVWSCSESSSTAVVKSMSEFSSSNKL